MEKKAYIQPSLKATELDEELLAGMSGGGDVNIPGDDSGEGDCRPYSLQRLGRGRGIRKDPS